MHNHFIGSLKNCLTFDFFGVIKFSRVLLMSVLLLVMRVLATFMEVLTSGMIPEVRTDLLPI